MMTIFPTILDPAKLDPKNYCTIGDVSYIQFKANSYAGMVTTGIVPSINSHSNTPEDIIIDLHSKLQETTAPIPIKDYVTIITPTKDYYTVHTSIFEYLVPRDTIAIEMTIEDYLEYSWGLLTFKIPKYSITLYAILLSMITLITLITKFVIAS